MVLVVFYIMIVSSCKGTVTLLKMIDQALSAWYYTGQPELEVMSQCLSVTEGIQKLVQSVDLDL